MATIKSKPIISKPGLVYSSLRGNTYVRGGFPGANINSNGRPNIKR